MAETRLTPVDIARIERGLDELIIPSFEDCRALVAENRRQAAEITRQARALMRIDSIIHHLTEGT